MSGVGLWLVDSNIFTASNNFELLMNSNYEKYRLIVKLTGASATLEIRGQLFNGLVGSTGTYAWYIAGGPNSENNVQATAKLCGMFSTVQRAAFAMDIIAPNLPEATFMLGDTWGNTAGGGLLTGNTMIEHFVSASYDRIRITTSTGNITGRAYLYGYSK